MKIAMKFLLAASALIATGAAHAGTINDNYIGLDSNNANAADVIGDKSVYDIASATIQRVGSLLTISINTNFAGKAPADTYASTNGSAGIGYGDVFLASTWTPNTSKANYAAESGASTKWNYGLALDNALSSASTGTFKLYSLNTNGSQVTSGTTNPGAIKTTDQTVTCSGCDFRNGQIDQVNTAASSGNVNTGITGNWKVDTVAQTLTFSLNVAGTDMVNWNNFAMHWGETCQNDAIEGITSVVPTPGSVPLMALGLVSLGLMRRRRQS